MIEILKNLEWYKLLDMAISVIPVLIVITVHECCHGLCALALGDTTARDMGRLSPNPIKHFDVLGFLMLITVGFGWAKPVPIDMRRFKNPKWGMALTALAGPMSNFVLTSLALFVAGVIWQPIYDTTVGYYVVTSVVRIATISLSLGVFNLIPISPLDGSKVLFAFLPERWYYMLMRYERYGMIVLVALSWFGILTVPMNIVSNFLLERFSIFLRLGESLGSLIFK